MTAARKNAAKCGTDSGYYAYHREYLAANPDQRRRKLEYQREYQLALRRERALARRLRRAGL